MFLPAFHSLESSFSFCQIEITHLWLDFYVFSSVGKALAISTICFGDAYVFSGGGFLHIPKWKTLRPSLLRNPRKISQILPSVSGGEQLWVTYLFFLRHCHLKQATVRKEALCCLLFSSFKGVWLKAKTIIPNSSHIKTTLYDSLWMLSCSKECLIRWVATCVNCNCKIVFTKSG